jgi:hypothetical protein
MNFGELQANVQSAMGRSDVPSFVYMLTTAGLNSDPDLRLLEMQAKTTLTTTSGDDSVALPANFVSVESAYINVGGRRSRLVPTTESAQSVRHDPSNQPYTYAVGNGELILMPVPDGEYTITLRYYARFADLAAPADTNATLDNYPQLYFYQSLIHAALWAQDDEGSARYSSAYTSVKDLAMKNDLKRRFAGPLIQRSAVQI